MSAKGPKGASAPSKTASGPGPTGKAAAASAEEKAMLEARAALAAKFGAAGVSPSGCWANTLSERQCGDC